MKKGISQHKIILPDQFTRKRDKKAIAKELEQKGGEKLARAKLGEMPLSEL